ncbi:TPA: hypothetical protein NID02_001604 [Pseudomonas aeruginosa]|nr:hypothetical protein [Pseudomonas aeruginosa]
MNDKKSKKHLQDRCTPSFKENFFKLAALTGAVRVRTKRTGDKIMSSRGISDFLDEAAANDFVELKRNDTLLERISSALVNANSNITQLFHIVKNDAVKIKGSESIQVKTFVSRYYKLNEPHFAFLTDIRKRQPVSHLIDSDSSFHQMLNALKNEHEIIPNTTRIHFELSETSFERFKGEGKSGLKPIDKILLFLDSVPLRINALQVSESEQHRLDILFKHYEDLNDVVKDLNRAIYIDREKHTNTFSIVDATRKIITLTKEIEALK